MLRYPKSFLSMRCIDTTKMFRMISEHFKIECDREEARKKGNEGKQSSFFFQTAPRFERKKKKTTAEGC